jgi:hypothetical protein
MNMEFMPFGEVTGNQLLCTYCEQRTHRSAGIPTRQADNLLRTRDHVKPMWAGGTLKVVCCRKCNNDKGGLFLEQWLEVLARDGDRRLEIVQRVAMAYPDLAKVDRRPRPLPADRRTRTDAEIMLDKMRRGEW